LLSFTEAAKKRILYGRNGKRKRNIFNPNTRKKVAAFALHYGRSPAAGVGSVAAFL
jgi:hypothetical protein